MSLDIPSGIILLWPGANGSIPSGFTRENDLNDKFPVGAASGAGSGATGGGNSHSHGTSHSHGGASHSHTGETPGRGSGYSCGTTNYTSGPVAAYDHTHSWTSATAPRNWSGGGAFGSGGADPSYYNMVFIKSDGSPETYPTNCVVMRNDADGVAGWTQHSGSKSRYIQGAGSGGNGGGTGGGGHTHAMGSHGHSFGGHSHSAVVNTAGATQSEVVSLATIDVMVEPPAAYHPLKISIAPHLGSTSSGSAPSMTNSNVTQAPSYRYVWGLEKTSGTAKEDEGMIVLWNDSIANIPEDWLLCDGTNGTPDLRDRFLRMANTSGEVGGTGGSNSHSHGGGSHSHSAGGTHTHLVNGGNTWPQFAIGWTNYSDWGNYGGTHHPSYHSVGNTSYWPSGSAGPFPCPTTTATSNSVDARPPYRTILYLYSPEGEEAGGNMGMFGSNF